MIASSTSRLTGTAANTVCSAMTVTTVASAASPTPIRIGRRNWAALAASR